MAKKASPKTSQKTPQSDPPATSAPPPPPVKDPERLHWADRFHKVISPTVMILLGTANIILTLVAFRANSHLASAQAERDMQSEAAQKLREEICFAAESTIKSQTATPDAQAAAALHLAVVKQKEIARLGLEIEAKWDLAMKAARKRLPIDWYVKADRR